MIEEWRWIPGYEGSYKVSDLGNLITYIKRHQVGEANELKSAADKDGYLRVGLWDGEKQRNRVGVHLLVLLAFAGPCPEKCEPNHIDGNKARNHLSNLEYKTKQENIIHSRRVLGKCIGERHGCAKFSNKTVRSLKRDLSSGMRKRDIADKYRCSVSLVKAIASGRLRQNDHIPEIKP